MLENIISDVNTFRMFITHRPSPEELPEGKHQPKEK